VNKEDFDEVGGNTYVIFEDDDKYLFCFEGKTTEGNTITSYVGNPELWDTIRFIAPDGTVLFEWSRLNDKSS
jgi:hypothetical protein